MPTSRRTATTDRRPRGDAPRTRGREERRGPPRREPPQGGAPPARAPRITQVKVHGLHAARALLARRPDDVLRVFLIEDRVRELGAELRELARRHVPYKVVPEAELDTITESRHHEGVCVVAKPRPAPRLPEILAQEGPVWLVALVGVGNPHNVGAIMRTAAHFGARAMLLAGGAGLSPAGYRTAQGGAEWIDVLPVPALDESLTLCRRAGFLVCATSSHEGRELYTADLPAKAVLLLGAEGEGLPPQLLARAERLLRIPGTGHVESLNVATAAGVVLAEAWRRHGALGAR